MMKIIGLVLIFLFNVLISVSAQSVKKQMTSSSFKAVGAPNNPKIEIAWNRYYDWKEIGDICARLAKAHPNLVHFSSIGKSFQQRDIFLLTVTNFRTAKAENKPAMYIDGNIHSNEVQGSEVSLYTAWFLAESYGKVKWITDLLDHKAFYIVPTINPDARDYYIHEPNTPHSPRSGLKPRDDDGDGLFDEDGFDDLDGDGHIVRMRRKNPSGRWKASEKDPRFMYRVEPDEMGDYEIIGWEGIDNDDDGLINEDGPGFYDPNRNWGWDWQPTYVQSGSDQYPFSLPETRAVADFILKHPNIGAAQSYHNSGGMILRGPGNKEGNEIYNPEDRKIYDFLGKLGEKQLPGYRYLTVYEDLYTVYGGELDWLYGAHGIYTFSNELWTSFDYFRGAEKRDEEYFKTRNNIYHFDQLLLFEEGILPWKTVKHPQFGEIEIGGVKKSWTRTAPSFLLEDMCHRNMAFTLFHAYHLPVISIDSVWITKRQGGLIQIDATILNKRVLPTRSAIEVQNNLTPPDRVMISGKGINVIAGLIVEDPLLDKAREQKHQPENLKIDTFKGMSHLQVRWIVSGSVPFTILVNSQRAGEIEKKFKP